MVEKLRGEAALELKLMNATWTVDQWIKWTLDNNCGLILNDGRVVGFETKPITFTE